MPQVAKAMEGPGDAEVSGVWPVLALGAFAWLAHLGWLRSASDSHALPLTWALAPLLLLGLGAGALWTRSASGLWVGRSLLLGLYPAAMVCSAAWLPQEEVERLVSPWSTPLSAVALLSYCVGAAVACRQPLPAAVSTEPTQAKPMPTSMQDLARGTLTVLWIGAALILTTVAPLSPDFAEVQRAWGDSAAAGAALAAVAAAALSTTSVAMFLGSMLRKSDAEPPLHGPALRTRVATLLLSAMLSSAVYAALSR
jgi:hypothetical protein